MNSTIVEPARTKEEGDALLHTHRGRIAWRFRLLSFWSLADAAETSVGVAVLLSVPVKLRTWSDEVFVISGALLILVQLVGGATLLRAKPWSRALVVCSIIGSLIRLHTVGIGPRFFSIEWLLFLVSAVLLFRSQESRLYFGLPMSEKQKADLLFALTQRPRLRHLRTAVAAAMLTVIVSSVGVGVSRMIRDNSMLVALRSFARWWDDYDRATRLRRQGHETLLLAIARRLREGERSGESNAGREQKYRQALAALTARESSGEGDLTLEDAFKSDSIRPVANFYLLTMGCTGQLAVSRSKLAQSPMEELLFFGSEGAEITGAADRLGISTFIITAEDANMAQVYYEKLPLVRVPLWWLQEDAGLLILHDLVRGRRSEGQLEAVGIIDDILSLRSRQHVQKDADESRINDLLSEVRGLLT